MFDLGDDNVDYMLNEMTSAQRRIILAYIQRLQKRITELEKGLAASPREQVAPSEDKMPETDAPIPAAGDAELIADARGIAQVLGRDGLTTAKETMVRLADRLAGANAIQEPVAGWKLVPIEPTYETMMSVTVGGGLQVYGLADAIHRVQNYILLDSTHPVEKEDIRRTLMRQLEAAEARAADLEDRYKTERKRAADLERARTTAGNIAADLERERDELNSEAARLTLDLLDEIEAKRAAVARIATLTEALGRCVSYLDSPVRMNDDSAEAIRRLQIVNAARAALQTEGNAEKSVFTP